MTTWRGAEAECVEWLRTDDDPEVSLRVLIRRAVAHGVRKATDLAVENHQALVFGGMPQHNLVKLADAIERGEIET